MKEYIKKIVICGDPAVGKTSLIKRYVTGKYSEKYITTLGAVISKKIVQFPEKCFNVNLQIWDISGQSEFKRVHATAFRSAEAALAVCDVTRPETIQSVYEWITNLKKHGKGRVPVIVMVNKFDLADAEPEIVSEALEMLENVFCPILTSSAKTGYNVELGFRIIAESIAPSPTSLPSASSDLVAMPELFENPYAFLDFILDRFSKTFGDEELSIHMIRTKAERSGSNFQKMPKEEALRIANHLIGLINNFKSEEHATELKKEYMEAYKRCNW
jgi:small GTP-binding protein